jgi:ABC-type multidrug transport system fused ATPase/permease subunit
MTNYNKYLERALIIGKKQVCRRAFGQALLFLLIFGLYAYSFFWGGYLRWNGIKNGDEEYTGGVIISCMFCVVFGSMQFMGAGPHIAAIAEGRIAGKLVYNVIDHVPNVDVDAPGHKVKREELKGEIVLKDVCFNYPTR